MTLYVGTMGWSYSFWKGSFYPPKLAPKDLLSYYAGRLNSVEVDSTFYRIPKVETIVSWKHQTPKDFLFSLKFPGRISHVKLLHDVEQETKAFIDHACLLGEKLGVLMLQLRPTFSESHFGRLANYLKALPKGYRYAVEVRNESILNGKLHSLLRDNNVALVWVDTPKLPKIDEETADFLYVRWEGDRKAIKGTLGKKETDRTNDIRSWANRLNPLLAKGKQVFGYFSKFYSGLPPSDAEELRQLLEGSPKPHQAVGL